MDEEGGTRRPRRAQKRWHQDIDPDIVLGLIPLFILMLLIIVTVFASSHIPQGRRVIVNTPSGAKYDCLKIGDSFTDCRETAR